MEIEKTEQLLNKFDYKFEKKNNQIIIKLDLAQRIIIDFSNPEKIKITDRLVGWNFLTGLIDMSIKNASIYNFIGALVLTIIIVYMDLEYDGINLIFFFLTWTFWVILWTTFYLIQAENIKRTLMIWNK